VDYFAVRAIHQTAVAVSFCGFFARGVGVIAAAKWVRSRITRTVPHVVDTVLLATALWLVWQWHATPRTTPWLVAKVFGLLAYVVLGGVALRPATPPRWRVAAWLAALATFAWIVSVAISKDPLGLFRALSA